MNDTLDETRRRIAREYIGTAGIHAVGLSRAKNAIRIYLKPNASAEQKAVLAEIRQTAKPYDVLVVEDEPAKVTTG